MAATQPPAQSSTMGEQRVEALGFKVMRLNRPNFFTPQSTLASSLLVGFPENGDAAARGHSPDWSVGTSESLMFPPGFGNIYLGETFSAYVSACNNSALDLSRVEVRAELQTGTKRITLLDGQASAFIPTFKPREHVDYVLEHELKEAGVHIMICTASYLEATGEERKVRQYFKFQVQKPLSVTTKLHFMANSIFLENQIQNITKRPLYLSLIKFEPTPLYTRTDLSDVSGAGLGGHQGTSSGWDGSSQDDAYGLETHLNPNDIRQFLYKLTPKEGILDPHDKKMEELGRLEMSWKTGLGEPGRLHSLVNLHQWRLPQQQSVSLMATKVPSRVTAQKPFEIEWSVQNRGARELDLGLELSMEAGLSGPVVPLGVCMYPLGIVLPGVTTTVKTQFVALETGLRAILPSDAAVIDLASARANAAPTRYHMTSEVHILVDPPGADSRTLQAQN